MSDRHQYYTSWRRFYSSIRCDSLIENNSANLKKQNREGAAAWITALATLIQTIAVTATLIFAFKTGVLEDFKLIQERKSATLSLFEDALKISDSRDYAHDALDCRQVIIGDVILSYESTRLATPYPDELINRCQEMDAKRDISRKIFKDTRPAKDLMERVYECVESTVCDQ